MLLVNRHFAPHRRWAWFTLLATALVIAVYGYFANRSERWPGGSSPVGLVLGIIGALIIGFEFLIWPRKWVRAWRIGRAQSWLRAHIWLGLLSVPVVLLHTGFDWGGPLSTCLLAVFLVVIGSGIYGLTLQQFLPRQMLTDVGSETIYSQIEYVARQHALDAEELIVNLCGRDVQGRSLRESALGSAGQQPRDDRDDHSGQVMVIGAQRTVGSVRGKVLQPRAAAGELTPDPQLFELFYETVGPYLLHGRRNSAALVARVSSPQFFIEARRLVSPGLESAVDTLETLCRQRCELDWQARLHGWLHGWLLVHLPLSVALVILLAVHAFVALKYL